MRDTMQVERCIYELPVPTIYSLKGIGIMAGVISDGEQVRGRAAKAGGNRRKVWRPIADAAAALMDYGLDPLPAAIEL